MVVYLIWAKQDFRDTPAYKESQIQEFREESKSTSADVFEGNPTEVGVP